MTMRADAITITKMQTLGNDFVILDARLAPALDPAWLRCLADRHLGVGCDQVLVFEPVADESHVYRYRIFNADGGEVGQCGNGALCLSQYLFKRFFDVVDEDALTLTLRTRSRDMLAKCMAGSVSVNVGVPDFAPASLPMEAPQADVYFLAGHDFQVVAVGNPHAVMVLDVPEGVTPQAHLDAFDLASVGEMFNTHAMFPEGVNVGVMVVGAVKDGLQDLTLRVYERGVGETQACGSGACAAAAVWLRAAQEGMACRVVMPGGRLQVTSDVDQGLWLRGPATEVFEACYEVKRS